MNMCATRNIPCPYALSDVGISASLPCIGTQEDCDKWLERCNKEQKEVEPLRVRFEKKFQEWQKGAEEHGSLAGPLLQYGATVGKGMRGILWDVLEVQIMHQAEKREMTPEEFVDYLFEAKDADTFMLLLQV